MSCGLTLHICLIIALSFRCRCWRQGFVTGQVSLSWSIALRTHVLCTRPRVLKERWREERTGFSSLNFFQVVFTRVVVESSQPPAVRACLLGSKRKLPPLVCQARLGLLSVVCRLRGVLFPCTVYTCNQGPLVKRLSPLHFLCTKCLQPLQKMLLLLTPVRQTAHGNSPEL